MSASNNVLDMPVEKYDLHHPDTHLQLLFTRVQLQSAILHGKPYHLIRPVHCQKVEEAHFKLGLTSAAATMEILHHEQWGPELVSIAEQLLNRGISFNLFIHAPVGKPACPVLP